jgi:hypothetical protein
VVGGVYHFEAIHRTDAPLGPAASWLVAQFAEQTSRGN